MLWCKGLKRYTEGNWAVDGLIPKDEGRLGTKCSTHRFVMAFHHFRTDLSVCEFVSSSCLFDSSAGLFDSSFLRVRFITQRGYNLTCFSWIVTWFHALIHDSSLHSSLSADWRWIIWRATYATALNSSWIKWIHESENGIGYLVTHTDRLLYTVARASWSFNIPH